MTEQWAIVVGALITLCGFSALTAGFIILRELRHLLKSVRKLASLYPPYPTSDEERGENQGTTSVHINPEWDEEIPGRD